MEHLLEQYQKRIHDYLSALLNQQHSCPDRLRQAMRYATLNNGKRIRPALVYAIGQAYNTPLEKLDSAAAAIEIIHCYSLVHDDLPAMDDDDLRRGQPTCHIQFDEATAILVGDALQALAFQELAKNTHLTSHQMITQIQILSQTSGSTGMVGGQMMDIESEAKQALTLHQLENLHQMKTGALIQAALLMGASATENYDKKVPGLVFLGQKIGLAFQIHDDILDIESSTKTLGKTQGRDIELDKSTFPKLLGLEQAKSYRDQTILEAKQSLKNLPIESTFLESLIDYITQRTF